jgi:hypothetical protein
MMNLDVRMHVGRVLVYMHIDLNMSHIVGIWANMASEKSCSQDHMIALFNIMYQSA